MELFAGIPVTDLSAAIDWYQALFGFPPAFFPNENEAVWELGKRNYVFIERNPEHAGHARHLLFVDDFDRRVAEIELRGIKLASRETLSNGVRKAIFRDPDGNQFELGGA